MQLHKDSTNQVINRLNKLVAPREVVLPSEPKEVLLSAPKNSIQQVSRIIFIVTLVIVVLWWLNKPAELTQIESLATSPNPTASSGGSLGQVVVHVAGDVVKPGIVNLPAGSRIIDAITAAGGLLPGINETGLNLAAHVNDGDLIQVGASSVAANDNRINLNTATAQELDTLPGVGPVVAKRILDWRTKHNHFSSIEELQEVEGIGPKLFERIKSSIRI
jgi:competence protein ComEA